MNKKLRIGMVCPYGWDIPGGVQSHIRELANHYVNQGHYVSVIAPVSDEDSVKDLWLVSAGRPIPIPFNGSVARVLFGPIASARVRSWISNGDFDVLHMHEPGIPSVSLLACFAAEGPLVGTFHASTPRLRAIAAVGPLIEPMIEKLSARIAVSEMAHDTLKNLYGTEAVVIPNGIDYEKLSMGRTSAASEHLDKPTIGFLGRFEEERKGLPLLLEALPIVIQSFPDLELIVAGPGDSERVMNKADASIASHVKFLGRLSDDEKVSFFHSLNAYIAPNTGGESFGIILAESMASGTPVIASDIHAFKAVLENGQHGILFESDNAQDLAKKIIELLRAPVRIDEFAEKGLSAARAYDWNSVASAIMSVYEMALVGNNKVSVGTENATWKRGR